MDKSELFKKIEKMNEEDLWAYHNSAKTAGRVMDVLGIAIILGIMFFYSIFTLVPGVFFLYVLANVSVSINDTVEFIEERIVDMVDK